MTNPMLPKLVRFQRPDRALPWARPDRATEAAVFGTDLAGYLTELPGVSAFALEDGVVYHTYSAYARGGEFLLGFYPMLDRVPKGRDEGDPPEDWIRRHDEYEPN